MVAGACCGDLCGKGIDRVVIVCGGQVLGTPTREEIKCMNPNYTEFKFPQIKAHPWHKVWIVWCCGVWCTVWGRSQGGVAHLWFLGCGR